SRGPVERSEPAKEKLRYLVSGGSYVLVGTPHLKSIVRFHRSAAVMLSGLSSIDQFRFFAVRQNVSNATGCGSFAHPLENTPTIRIKMARFI
ncbi:MAG: hypothetical protein JSS20_18635, partial [Proteobacteria bacterium]|nr:hypothetical protein [Pseudomonadota bacterium]